MSQVPKKDSEKPYLSASQVSMYGRCPEQYRRRYIEKDIIAPGAAMIRGTAVHAGAEHNFTQKVKSGSDLPVNEVVERAVDAVEQKVKHEGIELSEEEKSHGKTAVVDGIKLAAASLSVVMMKEVAPAIQPIGVEEKVRIELPEATRDLLAVLDIRTPKTVEDFKTTARSKGKAAWEGDTQMTMYALTFRALTGKDPESVRVHELVNTKVPKAVTHDLAFGIADYNPLVRRVNATLKGIESGNFPPTASGSWWCSPKWCGYWSSCPYQNAERAAAAEAQSL